jgi:HSP20 family protein
MATITRKDEGAEPQQRAGQRPFWDPFGMFAGWADPFGVLTAGARVFVPAFDVRETREAYVFEADLPGIKEDELEISVSGNRLNVSGRRESVQRDENERYSCSERAYGTFERTFTLSDDAQVEGVDAEFRDGVLLIEIPRRTEPQARRVPLASVQGADDGGQQHRRRQRQPKRKSSSARRRS